MMADRIITREPVILSDDAIEALWLAMLDAEPSARRDDHKGKCVVHKGGQ